MGVSINASTTSSHPFINGFSITSHPAIGGSPTYGTSHMNRIMIQTYIYICICIYTYILYVLHEFPYIRITLYSYYFSIYNPLYFPISPLFSMWLQPSLSFLSAGTRDAEPEAADHPAPSAADYRRFHWLILEMDLGIHNYIWIYIYICIYI